MSLIAELKRRKVFRVGATYLVAAWLAVQAASIGLPAFDAPPWMLRVFILIVSLGFPASIVLAWVFEWTPSGPKLERGQRISKRLFATAALLGVVAVGWFVYGLPAFQKEPARPVPLAASSAPPHERSIAVLPFVNMSSDKEQEYFSDGLSEELLNMLAQLPQLRVIARTSSFSFKGKDTDVATIARALNVAHVLEGSVRKSGSTVRITAQLIRGSDSTHLWSQTYDRTLDDALKVQDEIAAAVVAALKVKLLPAQRIVNSNRSANPEAYDQFLLGIRLSHESSEEGFRGAIAAFQSAIALDPGYAAAYARLAHAEVYASDYAANAQEHAAAKQRALAAADSAIALAPDWSGGYGVRGWMRSNFLWDWEGALADFEKARALSEGNYEDRRYGQLLSSIGRLDEGIAALKEAVELDPLASPVWGNLGYYLTANGEYKEARQALVRALAINPASSFSRWNLAQAMLLEGNAKEALATFRETDDGFELTGVALAEHTLGNERQSQQALDELIAGHGDVWAYQIAEIHAWRGDKDKAFEWLERAYAQHDGGMSDIKFDPLLAGLREDPRFAALLGKMGLD